MSEFYKATYSGQAQLAIRIHNRLINNGWTFIGTNLGTTESFYSSVGDSDNANIYIGVRPSGGYIYFRSYLYVENQTSWSNISTPGTNSKLNASVAGTVWIRVDEFSIVVAILSDSLAIYELVECGQSRRGVLLPERCRGWARTISPVVAAYPADRVFELDRSDVNDSFVVGDYITAVAMQTGALVSEKTTITAKNVGGYSTPNVQLDGVVNNYPTGSLVGILPAPGFCTENLGVPGSGVNYLRGQALLDADAVAAGSFTFSKFTKEVDTDLDNPSDFSPLMCGQPLKYMFRPYGVYGETVVAMPNHVWLMPSTAYLSLLNPGDRVSTGAGLDPSNFFLSPFGNLYESDFGIPVIGPDAVR